MVLQALSLRVLRIHAYCSGSGFFLDENRAQLAVAGEGGDGGLVNVAVVGAEPIEHLGEKCGIDGGVEFVGFHGGGG